MVCGLLTGVAGCSRYGDFVLPAASASGARAPFAWQASPGPVISRGAAGDVLNPSVVRFHGQYLNLFSVFDAPTWRTALATSADGVVWEKGGVVLEPEGWEGRYIAGNGSALVRGDEIFYWYEAGEPFQIALARSKDGKRWKKHGSPVLMPGPRGSFDERGVADPYVIATSGGFYMFYTGLDRARRQRLGMARSVDGVNWEKLRSSPILEVGQANSFDENGLGEPAVWASGGFYWMLYTGRSRTEQRRIGLAKSVDGVHWERDTSFPVIEGGEEWDREVVCDPTVEVTPGGIRVWFGGGNVRSPDQGLNGQIGMGFLRGSSSNLK
jgi:predicted GH43/DUF377 family glycosyl hydrolase